MSSKTIRTILSLMLLTIFGLFITQVYWFKKSFSLEGRQFDEKINIALRNVANTLLILDNNNLSKIPPISKTASNEYYIKTNSYYNLATLDSCIRKEFLLRNINVNFDYSIVKAKNQELVLGNTITNLFDDPSIACIGRMDDKENLDFKIRINNKTSHLLNSMGIWLYSSISLLILLAVFTFIILSIIKEKKLAMLKKDFVNNMTHELKTPITNISVASDAIRNRNDMDNQKLKKYADIIYNENTRLHNLVDTVLQISTIEKKEESLSFKIIDLHTIINNVITSFQPLIQEKEGSLKSKLNANQYLINADETHLTNVIYNLIENAIKYSKNYPEIILTTKNEKDGIFIEIKDKGIGMSKETQQRIFEKFFRAESGNIHNTKGYGLGLNYVKIIIEKHLGNITFKSTRNVGSCFKIYLPI
ncbi:two-component system, OmpR family, phosphate regulon sensor histidine kinase PhoR [Tenacibaculum sp. MAR_2010_89]|uniref:sensor histidine kinase n=1 Tax=Tenacibaculum sp. MAR_2010_89 TaxID=1250198 RepID=UPI00089455C9|nr:HAMP domain-containing sensor histidine kinase [Tenacibaculum sp. MAR_2010_89]SED43194.1 two-component system, OmpR family, phosphate regulon sensor histidine kinase PhoR [Tenacibaculum sp. MAR_2010_89]